MFGFQIIDPTKRVPEQAETDDSNQLPVLFSGSAQAKRKVTFRMDDDDANSADQQSSDETDKTSTTTGARGKFLLAQKFKQKSALKRQRQEEERSESEEEPAEYTV